MEEIKSLLKEFEQKVEEAQQKIGEYQAGQVEFSVVLEYVQVLNAMAGMFQVALGDQIRGYYTLAKKAKIERNVKELGY